MLVRLICAGNGVAAINSLSRVEAMFEEIHKSPRFCRRGAPGRKHGPQIKRWKAPLRQHRAHSTRAQFRGEHPFGRNGQPDMGEHSGSDTFGSCYFQSTLNLNPGFRAVPPKRPHAALALQIDDSLMLAEIGWRCGGAGALEVF